MVNPLGKSVSYSDVFDPALLFPIERAEARVRLGIRGALPFVGIDRWTCYELSWLDSRGVPQVAIATIEYPASSPRLGHRNSLLLNRAKNARNLLYLMSLSVFSRAFLSLSGMPVLSSR
jgi:NADPH-dependent 7-cyano-7-deazaguanine reductase QueF-like protein